MPLLQAYRTALKEFDYQEDPLQVEIVQHMQVLADKLKRRSEQGFVKSVIKKFNAKKLKPVKGLYIWGEVGRGKTFLMDLFYDELETPRKKRQHFHRFMHAVHDQLANLRNKQDTLTIVADSIAKDVDIICFDEFFVKRYCRCNDSWALVFRTV